MAYARFPSNLSATRYLQPGRATPLCVDGPTAPEETVRRKYHKAPFRRMKKPFMQLQVLGLLPETRVRQRTCAFKPTRLSIGIA